VTADLLAASWDPGEAGLAGGWEPGGFEVEYADPGGRELLADLSLALSHRTLVERAGHA
jgi:hypothetical protein